MKCLFGPFFSLFQNIYNAPDMNLIVLKLNLSPFAYNFSLHHQYVMPFFHCHPWYILSLSNSFNLIKDIYNMITLHKDIMITSKTIKISIKLFWLFLKEEIKWVSDSWEDFKILTIIFIMRNKFQFSKAKWISLMFK